MTTRSSDRKSGWKGLPENEARRRTHRRIRIEETGARPDQDRSDGNNGNYRVVHEHQVTHNDVDYTVTFSEQLSVQEQSRDPGNEVVVTLNQFLPAHQSDLSVEQNLAAGLAIALKSKEAGFPSRHGEPVGSGSSEADSASGPSSVVPSSRTSAFGGNPGLKAEMAFGTSLDKSVEFLLQGPLFTASGSSVPSGREWNKRRSQVRNQEDAANQDRSPTKPGASSVEATPKVVFGNQKIQLGDCGQPDPEASPGAEASGAAASRVQVDIDDEPPGNASVLRAVWQSIPQPLRFASLTIVAGLCFWLAWSQFQSRPRTQPASPPLVEASSEFTDGGDALRATFPGQPGLDQIDSAVFDLTAHPDWRLKTLSIEDIRVGMRVPALNPEAEGVVWLARAYGVQPHVLRTFVIDLQADDGTVQELVLTRPVSWVASRLLIATEINAELAAEEAAAHRIANPVLAGWRDAEGWTASTPLVVAAAVPVEVSTSVPGRLISRGVNPTGLFGAALSMVGETVTASMLDEVAARSFQSELETAILAGETNGLELYVDLPELEVEAWGGLKRVDPARATLDRADSEAISPSTHRLLRLTARREDGSTTRIELVRSVDWIRENLGDEAANWVHENHSSRPTTVGSAPRLQINLPELRLNGYADVTAIEPCPAIRTGPGEVVTATYHTDRAKVIDLRFEGASEPLGTTAEHPFWSVSRQSFVPAGELLPEETVVGIDGQHYRLTSITTRAGPQPVYNLEVAGQHSYFVTANGLLVHNADKGIYLGDLIDPRSGKRLGGAEPPPRIARNPAKTMKRATAENLRGTDVHTRYNPGDTYLTKRKDTRLELNGKSSYPDAVDHANHVVRELKPNNARGLSQGKADLKFYISVLEQLYPDTAGKWRGFVDLY